MYIRKSAVFFLFKSSRKIRNSVRSNRETKTSEKNGKDFISKTINENQTPIASWSKNDHRSCVQKPYIFLARQPFFPLRHSEVSLISYYTGLIVLFGEIGSIRLSIWDMVEKMKCEDGKPSATRREKHKRMENWSTLQSEVFFLRHTHPNNVGCDKFTCINFKLLPRSYKCGSEEDFWIFCIRGCFIFAHSVLKLSVNGIYLPFFWCRIMAVCISIAPFNPALCEVFHAAETP